MSPLKLRLGLTTCAIAWIILGASAAVAGDRCEGTLCDLYYGGSPTPSDAKPEPSKAEPARPTLIRPGDTLFGRFFSGGTAPAQQASPQQQSAAPAGPPAKKPLVAVQGGGLLGLMQGAPQQRCSGTLCDLYYGGPAPEEPVAGSLSPEPAATGTEEAGGEAPQTTYPSRVIEQPAERRCADTRDPWACYRH